jgi:transglutaminase-like putative cysteine protease
MRSIIGRTPGRPTRPRSTPSPAGQACAATLPYAPGVDPPDFHAVAELWLEGSWHLVDATGMARADELARVAVGRDATDIAFLTIFGRAQLLAQSVRVTRLP